MKNQMRIFYIRNSKNVPVGCIAMERVSGGFSFGVSTHNPADKFNRAIAREIAVGRFNKSALLMEILPREFDRNKTQKALMTLFRTKLMEDTRIPNRLCVALKATRQFWAV